MKYKGIIFDLDGTLLDTIEDISDSVNIVLEEEGEETFSYDEFKLKIGGGFRNLITRCFPDRESDEEIDRLLERLKSVYEDNYMNKSKPYDGIEELIDVLVDKGVKLGINSNKREEYTINLVDKIFPDVEFVKVTGQTDDRDVKPDPTGARLVLDSMGLDESEVLYIGDSNVDVLTGHNLGAKVVGVDWGFRGEEELKKYGADYIAYSPMDILDIVEG